MGGQDERIVKVFLPSALVRQLDLALGSRLGGYETRSEFIREACENMLVELGHASATPGRPIEFGGPGGDVAAAEDGAFAEFALLVGDEELELLTVDSLSETGLRDPGQPFVLRDGILDARDGPLLGLHNRDYPSLWAAGRLAAYTSERPMPWDQFRTRVTGAAWVYGRSLERAESTGSAGRVTALFPANLSKRRAAERNFQNFALGSLPKRAEGARIAGAGPLFAWQVCQLVREEGRLHVALTPEGVELLRALEGLSLEYPHAPGKAQTFLEHLGRFAPNDRWGFDFLLAALAERPGRELLVEAFAQYDATWTPAMASSFAQGYVARAREWGLVEPKLDGGRYSLTPFGQQVLHSSSSAEDRDR